MSNMTIYFFTKPGLVHTTFTLGWMAPNGERLITSLWEQNGKHYVLSGSKAAGTLQRFDFTETQEAELESFCSSTAANKEYFQHPFK